MLLHVCQKYINSVNSKQPLRTARRDHHPRVMCLFQFKREKYFIMGMYAMTSGATFSRFNLVYKDVAKNPKN
jgi:hypothetical protein